MLRGRPPKTNEEKLRTGNPGKRPINYDKFTPDASVPDCPPEFHGEARKEYKRIAAELDKYGMISEVDRNLLVMASVTWARFVEAEKMIAKAAKQGGGSGLFVKTPNGFPIQSPWLAVSNNAIQTYRAMCAEFGLSPAGRMRVAPQTAQLEIPGLELVKTEKAPISTLMR